MPLDVLDIIELRGEGIVNVDDDDLPVRLALIEKRHDSENFDLLDLANVSELFADFTDVEWVIVTVCFRLRVDLCRVFPCLFG